MRLVQAAGYEHAWQWEEQMQKTLSWEHVCQVQGIERGSVWREWPQQGEEKERRSEK